ncbi:uncharacterized protein LOC127877820 [Dreissena polymorpha]|uniref:B box-type domain-containing protein n=1 Tax=Dreissena polymorpha TaxID=45954 RepID=A0A9D4KBT4_DREPO|nr:uncharacterized protein LOC127877820 [Dreissena polymorpha]KAH3836721.1 hypothetical protein DPMN_110095 [Dreissena polymorpha]
MASKFQCVDHPSMSGVVICRDCKVIVCTRCYMNGQHKEECDVIDVNSVTSLYGKLATELIHLRQTLDKKKATRANVLEQIQNDKDNVVLRMKDELGQLLVKVAEIKSSNEEEMRASFDRYKKGIQKGGSTLKGLVAKLKEQIDDFILDEGSTTDDYKPAGSLKRLAQRKLAQISDGEKHPHGRFVLAEYLQSILDGRVKTFGSYTLHFPLARKS